jgi:GABA(A) receptor-associated protein
MSISTSYSVQGVLQPTFASQTEMTTITPATTTSTATAIPATFPSIKSTTSEQKPVSNDYLERLKKSQVILEKYPDRVPLIIQPSKTDRDQFPIDKSKYITPRDLTMMQLQQIIRKRIRFPSERALFMFVNNKMFPITSLIGNIYDDNKDDDGFLYVTYCQENTFG